ncbi:nicotinate phosphoribosyltransferase [Hyaloraphidium curvatum]|nr:nicotinate phosphoribosyltransferase [Hyaloraphidium curvatum]
MMPPTPVPPVDDTGDYYLDKDDKYSPNGVQSILDTDWYKLTMMQAVAEHYPEAYVHYRFKTRNPKRDVFPKPAYDVLVKKLNDMEHVALTDEEEQWLLSTTPYLKPAFVARLKQFRFRPREQLQVSLTPEGIVEIDIRGKWVDVILYEVPILYLISETFFEYVETDWDYMHPADQREQARRKIAQLFEGDCFFSDFGTRRRRSYRAQETVIRELAKAHFAEIEKTGKPFSHCSGTSNVNFARLYNLRPVGTVAHEWTMALSALEATTGLKHANKMALSKWASTYTGPDFRIALSDTFGVDAFLEDFDDNLADMYRGTRHDSGDATVYVDKIVGHYKKLGIDPAEKVIVFSDALSIAKCLRYKKYADSKGIESRFGIGTHLTNDFKFISDPAKSSSTLNIVIKLHSVARTPADKQIPVVKLSDEPDKYTGDKEAVQEALQVFGLSKS